MKRFARSILWGLALLYSLVSCTSSEAADHDSIQVLVPDSISHDTVLAWEDQVGGQFKSGIEIVPVPISKFREKIYAELLSGEPSWEAALIDGEWVSEFIIFQAIQPILPNNEPADQRTNNQYSIPYSLDPLVLVWRSDPDERIEFLASQLIQDGLSLASWIRQNQIRAGFTGAHQGYPGRWLDSTSGVGWTSSNSKDLNAWEGLFCKDRPPFIDQHSIGWSPADLVAAVQDRQIDVGILWLSQLQEFDRLDGLNYFLVPDEIVTARSINWVIPSNAPDPQTVMDLLNHLAPFPILSTESAEDSPLKFVNHFVIDRNRRLFELREDIREDLDSLAHQCLAGEAGPEQYSLEYERIIRQGTNYLSLLER